MSKTSGWDTTLDAAGLTDPAERATLSKALGMAQELLQPFANRIQWIGIEFEEYSSKDKRLPLVMAVTDTNDEESADLRMELAKKVFGPVLRATWISMPIVEVLPADTPAAAEFPRVNVLYPAAA